MELGKRLQGGPAQLHPVVGAIAPIFVDVRSLGRFLVKRGRTGVQTATTDGHLRVNKNKNLYSQF